MLYTTIDTTNTTRDELKAALKEARQSGLTNIKLNVSNAAMQTEIERLQSQPQTVDAPITYEEAMTAADEFFANEAETHEMLDAAQKHLDECDDVETHVTPIAHSFRDMLRQCQRHTVRTPKVGFTFAMTENQIATFKREMKRGLRDLRRVIEHTDRMFADARRQLVIT